MAVSEISKPHAEVWPLSIEACHALGDFWRQHPSTAELVIEVCVTSHEYDRSKLRAYAQAGVKEVWFVLGLEKQIEVHRQPCADEYAERIIHGPGGTLVSNALPAFHLDLGQLFEN